MEAPDVAPVDVVVADAVEATAVDAAAGAAAEDGAVTEDAPAANADEEAPAGVDAPAKTPKAKPKPKPAPEATPGSEGGTGGRVRRERKQTDFFLPVEAPKKDVEEVLAVGAGSGTRLRDIPNVAFKLGKVTGKDELVEGLHNLLFRRKGVASTRKKVVLDFAGFAFAEDQKEKEVEARRASLGKWKLDLLHRLMDALDLPRGSGDKAAKVERVLEFLQEPRALSGVDLAAKEAAKKEKERAKKERAAAKKDKEAAKKEKGAKRKSAGGAGRATKKAKKEAEEEEEEEEGGESEAEEEGEGGDEGEESEEEKLPAKKDRRSGAGRARQPAAAAEAAAEPMDEDGAEAEQQADPAGEVPAAKLKASVEAILKAVPAEELPSITPKPILRKLEAEYGFSLKSRKPEIIAIAQAFVQAYIDANPAAAEPAEGAAGEEAEPAAEAPETEAAAAAEVAAPAEETAGPAEEAAAAGVEGGGPATGDGA